MATLSIFSKITAIASMTLLASGAHSEVLRTVDQKCFAVAYVGCTIYLDVIDQNARIERKKTSEGGYSYAFFPNAGVGQKFNYRNPNKSELLKTNGIAVHGHVCEPYAKTMAAWYCTDSIDIPSSSEVEAAIANGNEKAMKAALSALENVTD